MEIRPPSIAVLHRDDAVIAVAKPSGLAVHKGWADDDHYALDLARDAAGRWVYPVHRLDRATSGVLLFALSPEDAEVLSAQFRAHAVAKRYLALVRGAVPDDLVIDRPLVREGATEASPAVTRVSRLWLSPRGLGPPAGEGRAGARYSLVAAAPETGRQHQIRRHLRGLSFPIIGDVRYGRGEQNRHFRAAWGLGRLALHAARLTFVHPRTGDTMSLLAPLPDDLAEPLGALGVPAELLTP